MSLDERPGSFKLPHGILIIDDHCDINKKELPESNKIELPKSNKMELPLNLKSIDNITQPKRMQLNNKFTKLETIPENDVITNTDSINESDENVPLLEENDDEDDEPNECGCGFCIFSGVLAIITFGLGYFYLL